MNCICRTCGGSIDYEPGDTLGTCRKCGAKQALSGPGAASGSLEDAEKNKVYEQAAALARENTEAGLEQAMQLYASIRGWRDAAEQFIICRTQLGRMRWQTESKWLKDEEDRFEAKMARWKKRGTVLLAAVLLCIAVVTAVSLHRYKRYNAAAAAFTAGEYEKSAAAFQAISGYKDAKARVFMSAVELYKARRYEEALPYFVWLDGYIDNGYYLQKCRDRMTVPGSPAPGSDPAA